MDSALKLTTHQSDLKSKVNVDVLARVGGRDTNHDNNLDNQSRSTPSVVYDENVSDAFSYEAVIKSKPSTPASRQTFHPLQEWEGYVSEINMEEGFFSADLVDISSGSKTITGTVEFELEELSPADRKLLAAGAVFRWSVGYMDANGTRKRLSQIVFRNLPVWTKSDLESGKSFGIEKLNWR